METIVDISDELSELSVHTMSLLKMFVATYLSETFGIFISLPMPNKPLGGFVT